MGMFSNRTTPKATTSNNNKSNQQLNDRFLIGNSGLYFELASYLSGTGRVTPAKVQSLLRNQSEHGEASIEPTEGKSLKVMFTLTGTQETQVDEIKFCGFITAGDASMELDASDIDAVMQEIANGEVVKAISADSLVDMF